MKKRTAEQTLSAAMNEAGHAVACERFRIDYSHVTIARDFKEGEEGAIVWGDAGGPVRWLIIMGYAGLAAQRLVEPTRGKATASSDYERAAELLQVVDETQQELEAEAAAFVQKQRAAIEAVAAALIESTTLQAEEVAVIVECVDFSADWHSGLAQFRRLASGEASQEGGEG